MEMRIAARKGRVFLDSFRNAFGQTVVSPYSVRRRPARARLDAARVVRGEGVAATPRTSTIGELRDAPRRSPTRGPASSGAGSRSKPAMEALKRL